MTSVLNFPDWFVKVFVLFAFDYAYMGKLTLSLYYFDLHTPSLRRLRNYGCSGFAVIVEVRGKISASGGENCSEYFCRHWTKGGKWVGYSLAAG